MVVGVTFQPRFFTPLRLASCPLCASLLRGSLRFNTPVKHFFVSETAVKFASPLLRGVALQLNESTPPVAELRYIAGCILDADNTGKHPRGRVCTTSVEYNGSCFASSHGFGLIAEPS